ncbi:MAG: methyltransferase domain-containing protein [Spirochaetaceae bacterium]|nr:MAG: methyltransferase domain-containing protein [Spirochaetaceae bacterium]
MNDIREGVRKRYGSIAESAGSCCGYTPAGGAPAAGAPSAGAPVAPPGASSCCGSAGEIGLVNGYTRSDISEVPEGSNLGLGCGNPTAIGSLREGETVLDLGSGAGFDCFLAARRVGAGGRVIGLDMTPQMLERARANAERGGYTNVEFIQGYIESIPLPDSSVDVVISNCVINLSVDKPQVFREVARVLKPGGRMYVSDLVLTRPLPALLRRSVALYAACVAGAMTRSDYLEAIASAGLAGITIVSERGYPLEVMSADPSLKRIATLVRLLPFLRRRVETVVSLSVRAEKGDERPG